jgi:hypothetical protein
MHKFLKKIESIARNPWVEAFIGVILLVTGFAEAGENIIEDIKSGNVGAHHGIIMMGLAHAFKSVPSILASMMLFADAEKHEG